VQQAETLIGISFQPLREIEAADGPASLSDYLPYMNGRLFSTVIAQFPSMFGMQ
jgi:hypothetical protein